MGEGEDDENGGKEGVARKSAGEDNCNLREGERRDQRKIERVEQGE